MKRADIRQHQADVELREISASDWPRQRFAWLVGVRRDPGLDMTAKYTAHVLVLDFTNKDTQRCDPSFAQIAERLGASRDTAKRAVKALERARHLDRKPARWKSDRSRYSFLSRARIIVLKGGTRAPHSNPGKGGTHAPPQYNPW